jgi:hypothetical protein
MKTPNTSSMLIARRLAYTIAALAMLIWTCNPAQADFLGTLQSNQTWSLAVDNSNNSEAAAVTIFYLGKTLSFNSISIAAETLPDLHDLQIPKFTGRIIIQLDPAFGMSTPVLVTQGATAFTNPGFSGTLVLNVE